MTMMDESAPEFPLILNSDEKSSPFINCLRNNYRHLKKWAKRTHTTAPAI